jgi:hypothetical protein
MKVQIIAACCVLASATSYDSFNGELGEMGSFGSFGSYMLEGYPVYPANTKALPPTWITSDIEAPACEKDMGSWTASVFCPEQMDRLSVNELGEPTDSSVPETPSDLMPLDWDKKDEHMFGEDPATYTPDYIMEKEKELEQPDETVTLTNLAAVQTSSVVDEVPKSSSHTGGIVAGVAAVGLVAAFVTFRNRNAGNSSPGEFDYSTL